MKKATSILLIAVLLITGVFVLTGCGNGEGDGNKKKTNTVEISQVLGAGTVTVSVPKNDDGTPKYQFTKDKPKEVKGSGTFYLETDNVAMSFGTHGLVYNTATYFKNKHGEQPASFEGYLEWMKDPDSTIKLYGMETFNFNGRDALRHYAREGGSGDYKYYGYNYMFSLDDINPKMRLEVVAYYKGLEELPKEAKEFDEETLKVIKSLKLEVNKK